MPRLSRLAYPLLALALFTAPLAAQLSGPTSHLGFFDSPFNGLGPWSYFHLETFEDHLFNVPGVTASAGGVTSVVSGPLLHDSVDEDDGVLDGAGRQGDDFFASDGATGITFTFNAALLGALPTHVGLVWTDGLSPIFFEAFDQNGLSLGSLTGSHANGSFNGETDEDRFYGATNGGGISRVLIRNSVAGIEIDHLQYGRLGPAVTTPEPATLALVGGGLVALGVLLRRRR